MGHGGNTVRFWALAPTGRRESRLSFCKSLLLLFRGIMVICLHFWVSPTRLELRPQSPFFLFPAPVHSCSSRTTMDHDLSLIPLLQRQLETTLQVLISASSAMTVDEIMLVQIRLTEANLVMRDIVVDRGNNITNGNSLPTICSMLTHFLMPFDSGCTWLPRS